MMFWVINTHQWKKYCAKLIMQRFSETSMDVEKRFTFSNRIPFEKSQKSHEFDKALNVIKLSII